MFALTRLVRERSCSSSLVAGALLGCALSTPARAQCGDEVVLKYLDSGTTAPALITPKGAPVIGGDFSFRVFEAPPLSSGFLIYSGFDNPVFDPLFDATIWTTTPFFSKSFSTNVQGRSGPLFLSSVVSDDLCGAQATFQALVLGGSSPSGFAVSNGMRLRVGSVTRPPLAYDALATDGTETPGPLALGDMDEDGIRDLVSVSTNDEKAWVRPGLAGGGFGPGQKTALANLNVFFTFLVEYADVADFDGDGFLDLVRKVEDGLSFAYGDGAGGFLSESTATLAQPLSRAHVGDLDNDGTLDVVAAREGSVSQNGKNISVLLGTNAGSFSAPVTYVAAVTPHTGIGADVGAADLDEDGDLDLAVAIGLDQAGSSTHLFQTSILEGAGDGTFGSPVSYADTTAPQGTGGIRAASIALVDLDGDTFVDVATTFEVNRRLYVRRGNGDLTLDPVEEHVVGNEPRDFVVADVDDDAIVDLLTLNFGSGDVSVLLGLGDGTFASSGTFGVFRGPRGMAVDDVDLDGTQDLLVTVDQGTSASDNQILQVAGDGNGTFAGAHRYLFGEGLAVIADFDGNGANDVITGAEFGAGGLVFHPYPFGPATTVSSLEVRRARAAHVNGDAFIDLVVQQQLPPFSSPITVLPGLGDGTFGPKLDTSFSMPLPFVLADFDGDQVLDIAANEYLSDAIAVALGNGDGTFADPVSHTTGNSSGLAVGDVDGNGTQDLVYELILGGPNTISMRPGNGDGTFGPEETLVTDSVSTSSDGTNLVDLGRDGDLDIVTADSSFLRHYANDGTGSFALTQTLSVPGPYLEFADMDGDGDTDVVGWGTSFGYLVLWEEPGVLGPPTEFPLGVTQNGIAIGDLDRDGMPDIAVADDFAAVGRLSIRYNQVGE